MSQRETLGRYNLIINKLRKNPATFKEITGYLELESEIQSYDFVVSQRTFQRDIQQIYSLFNIEIKFDKKRKAYFIDNSEQPEIHDRMLEAFDTISALNISDGLSAYIHFEQRRPVGSENLYGLLHAIKNRKQIKFTYHKYWISEVSQRQAHPYALKEFKSRWYVLAKDLKDQAVKSFALDRLRDLQIANAGFEFPQNYNVKEQYQYCFGIISPGKNDTPQDIELSFSSLQGKYIKSLPLHATQHIIKETDDEIRIGLKLYITHDLMMELLTYGEEMKVLKPVSLAREIRQMHLDAAERYKGD